MSFVRECIDALERGASGVSVLESMRKHYSTPLTLRSKTSLVRCGYAGPLDEDGEAAAAALRAACREGTDDADRVSRLVSMYGRGAWSASSPPTALDAAVLAKRHLLLPARVRDVHITSSEVRECVRHRQAQLVVRHDRAPCVDGDAWLAHAREVAARPDAHGVYEVALALLVLTGRRTSEILNGRSSFSPPTTADAPNLVVFRGQLKRPTRHGAAGDADDYEIPLLHSPAVVNAALASLRSRQPADVATWTNARVTSRYQSGLNAHMGKHAVYGGHPDVRVHTTRSVYAALVAAHFDCGARTPQAVAKRVCGHRSIQDALAYTALRVTITPPATRMGRLPPDEEGATTTTTL